MKHHLLTISASKGICYSIIKTFSLDLSYKVCSYYGKGIFLLTINHFGVNSYGRVSLNQKCCKNVAVQQLQESQSECKQNF